jgi:hypothetical protein
LLHVTAGETVSSGDANMTNRGRIRWPDRPVTGFTPPRIFSHHPGVIYLSRGTNLLGEHELWQKITSVRFTTLEMFLVMYHGDLR